METQTDREANETLTTPMVAANTAEKAPEENSLEETGILIGKNDILFGRGGLTNHHFGNKKYRDVINEYRQEYVDAKKVEKPRVAKRVVRKILNAGFADTPVRFLKKDEDGLWVEVDEHEAAGKVSQALREKTRWSCMKTEPDVSVAVALKLEVEPSSADAPTKKRSSSDGSKTDDNAAKKVLKIESTDKVTGETKVKEILVDGPEKDILQQQQENIAGLAQQPSTPVLAPEITFTEFKPMKLAQTVPTASQISVPPLELSVGIAPNDGSMPTQADVLFGRGGRTNHHPGNKRLRMIVDEYKHAYEAARKMDKPKYAKAIVQALREHSSPSRFLRLNENTGHWEDVGDRRAAEKVSQTLREKEKSSKKDTPPVVPPAVTDETSTLPASTPMALI